MARTLRMLTRGRLTFCSRSSAATTWLTKEVGEQHGSNIQWRGRSNAASAPSGVPNSEKNRKKVSKDQRRAMLESYVNKYKEANAGKFPSASKAKKEVGGDYYILRRLIQELEYDSKMDQLTSGLKTPMRNEKSKNRKSGTEIRDSSRQPTIDARNESVAEAMTSRGADICENLRDETTASHEFLKPAADGINRDLVEGQSTSERKDDQEIPCPPERHEDVGKEVSDDQPKFVSEQTRVKEEIKEDNEEDKSPRGSSDVTEEVDRATSNELKGLTGLDSPQRQEKQHQASDLSVEKQDAEPPRKSSLWGNLKSFADGIISIWRNR